MFCGACIDRVLRVLWDASGVNLSSLLAQRAIEMSRNLKRLLTISIFMNIISMLAVSYIVYDYFYYRGYDKYFLDKRIKYEAINPGMDKVDLYKHLGAPTYIVQDNHPVVLTWDKTPLPEYESSNARFRVCYEYSYGSLFPVNNRVIITLNENNKVIAKHVDSGIMEMPSSYIEKLDHSRFLSIMAWLIELYRF